MPSKSHKTIVAKSKIIRCAVESLEVRRLLAATPTVNTVTPAQGATGVALNAPITATVNLPNGGLDPNTVIGANVMLYPVSNPFNDGDVPAIVNTTGGGDAIILTPSVNLQPNTQYVFSVSTGVADIHGDAMTAFSETFTTGNTQPPVNQQIAFSKTVLPTSSGVPFTDMQFGPDGKLYASTEDGRIFRYPVNADGTLGTPQVIYSLQQANQGNRLISGFAFDPASTATNLKIWVSNTFYALSGATNGQNFTGKLTVMSGPDLGTVQDAIIGLPRSVADHVNDQPVFQPGTDNLFFCQAGENAYGAPDTTWGNRSETELSAAILEVNTTLLTPGTPLNVLTPDDKTDAGVSLGGTYDPTAPGAPLTIYATGIRNAFTLLFDSSGQLWAPANGSSSGGNTPAGGGAPALTDVQQVEEDNLFKVEPGAYYGHPDPVRGQYVLDDGNPSTGAIPGLAFTAYPSGTNPDPNYQPPNYVFGVHNSPDGMIQYTGIAFGGALNGRFLVAEYSAGDDIVVLTPDASDNIVGGFQASATGVNAGLGPDRTISGFSGFDNPVTLIENPATGYIYVSELGGDKITLLKPSNVPATISVSTPVLAFNGVATGDTGAGPSRVETVTLTNTGADVLTLGAGAISIINNPASSTQNAADFTIANLANLPGSLAAGQSTTIQLTYTATTTGIQSALLQVMSSSAVITPVVNVTLNGIGTAGQFGYLEPSLVQVLRANDIPTIVGAGPDDSDSTNPTYPENPDPSSQEVPMQEMVVAGPGPVTITTLASFNASATPSLRFGYYAAGNPNSTQELFTISNGDAQTVYPTALGATSFNPGSSPFGLYAISTGVVVAGGGTNIHYSEDIFNTPLDPVNPRKFRFFPMENPDGSVVPNAYLVAAEDYNSTTYNSFVNFLGIIRNVMPAPNATNAPQIGVVSLTSPASAPQLPFNRIQIPNSTVADVVHDSNTLQINNSGSQPLTINSLTFSDTTNWTLVNPPTLPAVIDAGGSLDVTIQFIAQASPPHTGNQTATQATTNGVSTNIAGGVWNGTLTIGSSDPTNPATVVKLAGYWQYQTENENGPSLATIINLIYGYNTNVSSTTAAAPDYPNSGKTAVDYGSEVVSGLWNVADATQPVSVQYLASYHNEYDTLNNPPTANAAAFGYYLMGSATTNFLLKQEFNSTQTLLPPITADGATLATSFTPTGQFGFNIGGEFSQDNLNTVDINTYGRSGHAIRFFPLIDGNGNVVPNTYIAAMDYGNGAIDPDAYQDNLFLISNITPVAVPPTPNDLQVSQGPTGVNIQWAPVTGATGYNVLRATNGGSFSQINTSTISGSSFVDLTAPQGNTVNYEVKAVNSSKVSSYPATASLTLSVTETNPVTQPPAAPTNVQGDGSSGTQIALTWAASPGATDYIIQRQNPGSSTFVTLTSIDTVNSYADTSVVAGALYTYQVAATNSGGTSSFTASNPVTVTLPAVPTTPTNVTADGSSGTQIVVSWSASTNATSYDVLRELSGASSFTQVAGDLTTTVYDDTDVTPGNTYLYEVDVRDASVTSAPSSPPVSATVIIPTSVPPTPANLAANGSSGVQVLLNWSLSVGATSYTVSRMGPTDSTFVPIATGLTLPMYTDTNVSSGSSYSYEVAAVNALGPSAFSTPITITIPAPAPTAPTNVQLDGSSGSQVVVSWDPDSSATTFNVDRQTSAGGAFLQVANNLTGTSFTDTSVISGNTYTYRVDAVNSTGATPSTPETLTLPQPPMTLDVAIGAGASKFVQFTAANGTLTTISLTGPGTATVDFTANTISQTPGGAGAIVTGSNIAVADIAITGSSGASMLKIASAHSGPVPIGAITADSALGAISATNVALIGDLSIPGSIKKLILNSATASTLTIGGSIGLLQIGSANGIAINSSGAIKSIVANTWNSTSAITAPAIGAIAIKGNTTFAIAANTVHSIKIGGALSNSTITLFGGATLDLAMLIAGQISGTTIKAAGNLGAILAGSMANSAIDAGVGALATAQSLPTTATDFASQSSIASVTLKGSFADSEIAAAAIKKLSLARVQFTNGGAPFGVAAVNIASITGVDPSTGKAFTFKKLTSENIVTADLAAKGISPGDFVLRIV